MNSSWGGSDEIMKEALEQTDNVSQAGHLAVFVNFTNFFLRLRLNKQRIQISLRPMERIIKA